jgi:FkbM family methyltransferase
MTGAFMTVQLLHGILGTPQTIDGQTCIVTAKSDYGVIVYGPYEDRAPGRYEVRYSLGLADDTHPLGDSVCAKIELLTKGGTRMIAEKYLLFSDLKPGLSHHSMTFNLPEPRKLEYRVQSMGQVPLNIADNVTVAALAPAPPPSPYGSQQRAWENEREFLDGYLRNVSGLIHVGANHGQERRYYWLLGLDVIWVEPIREIYENLVDNIAIFPRQRAVHALLTDKEGDEVELRIANNGGASSSILPLEQHAQIFPDIQYVEHRKLISTTLAAMIRKEAIDLAHYCALTLDTEGAELMILQGAGDLLGQFEYVKCEVADFPARSGTPSTADLDRILSAAGFAQLSRRQFAMGPGLTGTYWDIVWKKVRPGEPLHEPGIQLPIVINPHDVTGLEKSD